MGEREGGRERGRENEWEGERWKGGERARTGWTKRKREERMRGRVILLFLRLQTDWKAREFTHIISTHREGHLSPPHPGSCSSIICPAKTMPP